MAAERAALRKPAGNGRPVRAGFGLALAVVIWLVLVRAGSYAFNGAKLPDRLQDLLTLMSSVILESMPFVLLGIVLSVVVQVWLPARWTTKLASARPVSRRLGVSFLGLLVPVCECGNLPLSRGLLLKGFSVGESLTFLLAAPIVNPITILTTHQAFPNDPAVLWARLAGGLLIANAVGWLYSLHRDPDSLLTPAFAAACRRHGDDHDGDHNGYDDGGGRLRRLRPRLRRSLGLFASEAAAVLPALFVGALVAGLVQTVLPRSLLYEIGANPVWSITVMMALAFIMSICSNVDAFFALAFSSSFTSGSVVSFLVFGPVVDIKMLTLMRTTYRPSVLVTVTIIAALLSAITGLVVQYAF